VIQVIDGDYAATRAALREFAAQVEGAEVGLFYYAGHGLQVDGRNYLVPVDAKLVHERELFWQAFGTDFALQLMETAGVPVKLMILDACRDNPLARNLARSVSAAGRSTAIGRGLAPVERVSGTLIAYATAPGAIAEDGSGRNSPFTTALLKWIDAPDLDVRAMFGQVRADVMAATGKKQVPWVSESIVGEFRFRVEIPVPPPAAAPTPPGAPAEPGPAAFELAFWNSIADSDDAAVFEEYLKQFPDGRFAGLARRKIETAMAGPPAPAIEPVEAAYVAVKNANVREQPTVRSAKVAMVERGTEVHVAGKVKGRNWYLVERDDKPLGYVYGELLLPPEEARVALAPPPAPERPSAATPAVGAYPSTRRPGETFRDCAECPEMVVIPAGSFTMGSPASEEGRDDNEGPQHRVTIPRPFALGKYEVTFAEWDACVREGGCSHRPSDQGWGRGNRPVINVSWEDARQYGRWLGRKTGHEYRLPSEAEWEYAARAGTTTPFHFGRMISPSQANYDGNYSYNNGPKGAYRQQTIAVGSFPANAFGLHDVHGNVWEWVKDCWNGSYRGTPTDGVAWTTEQCAGRVLRGGSWYDNPRNVRSADRVRDDSGDRDNILGFRLARTLP
jgi:formylglycine-generating enzyme required for sulfatase activity